MIDGWQWDSSLFKGASTYYERGRLPYAPGFVETITAALDLDGCGRLLDVGCGPGILTLALAPHFAEVIGLDPDEDMLTEASRQAALRAVTNASWVTARAKDLPADLGEFRAVIFGRSFHWMDRDKVATTTLAMLEPGGAFIHISDPDVLPADLDLPPVHLPPLPRPAPPFAEINDLVRHYLGPIRRAGQGTIPNGTPNREDLVLARAGFENFERHVLPAGHVVERTADDIVAWVFSLSHSAPHLFEARITDFEQDLRALLHQTAPDNRFAEHLPTTLIMTWRKPHTDR